ncbi:MAG: hypothetical protein GX605_12930 [Chloroflexi bacterium]|nr:hypothetical protein [Chloroflexota bacterium]
MEPDEFTARLMSDMEPDLLEFIKNKINSFIKWDLIRFFHENPHTVDTAENIARYAGRNPVAVKPELEELAAAGVMQQQQLGEVALYTLTHDEGTRQLVRRFAQACEDRRFRVKAVYHIIKGMN